MSVVDDAERWLEGFKQAVKESAYNCECQVGGVDALSIDTDYLNHGLRLLTAAWTTLRQGDGE